MTAPVLSDVWDVQKMLFGRRRHTLSLANDDNEVVIMLVERPLQRVEWMVSPPGPGFAEKAFDEGVVDAVGRDTTECVEEAKKLAFAVWERWCKQSQEEPPFVRKAYVTLEIQWVPDVHTDPSSWDYSGILDHDCSVTLHADYTAMRAYVKYVQSNMERIARDGWVPVSYEEFRSSEDFKAFAEDGE